MASFRKRGKKWEAHISFKDKDGEFKTKSKAGFKIEVQHLND